ncbi:MAG: ThiF family adenylyltransferase, partial [Myxococcota bacterium]
NQMLPAGAVGEPKAHVRARQMAALNPSCPVRALPARVEDLGLGVFADCDVLLTGLDGRASRLTVNRIAQLLGIDWIDAAVDGSGERLLGTVTWFRPYDADGPCYGCQLDGARLAAIAAEGRGAGCASWRAPGLPDTPPTLTASPFGAVVAGHQMAWAIQALLGEGEDLVGHQLQIAGSGMPRARGVALARGPRCVFPHRRLAALRRVECRTPAALLERAAGDLGAPPEALVFPGRSLAHGLVCPLCGATRALVKRREAVRDDEVRCGCDTTAEMLPRALVDRLTAAQARRLDGVGWSALGLPPGDLVVARAAGREDVHYLLPPEEEA